MKSLCLLPAASLLLVVPLQGCPDGGDGTIEPDDDSSVADDDAATDDDDVTPTWPEDVELETDDGLVIRGTFQAAEGIEVAPAVLLLHEIARDRGDFNTVFLGFVQAGISALAIDMRGHGESDPASVSLEDLQTDPAQLPRDVVASLVWLRAREDVDPARIGVMGLDVGASLAVVADHYREDWGVLSICAISPSVDHIHALASTDQLDLVDAQYVAGENEHPGAEEAQALYDITAEPRDLRLVQFTDDHGIDLLTGSVDAQNGTVAWFVEELEE